MVFRKIRFDFCGLLFSSPLMRRAAFWTDKVPKGYVLARVFHEYVVIFLDAEANSVFPNLIFEKH
jgi:hypothetical protein